MDLTLLERRLKRSQAQIQVLERMIEDKVRQVFQATEELEHQKEYLTSIVDSMTEILLVADTEQRIVFANKAARKLLQYSKSELKNTCMEELLSQRELAKWEAWNKSFIEGKKGEKAEFSWKTKEGESKMLLLSGAPLEDVTGKASGILYVAQDLTERKFLEMQLLQAQKMEAIGQLAAGVAHEINTPTQYIGDNVEFIGTSFEELQQVCASYENLALQCREKGMFSEALDAIEKIKEEVDFEYLTEEIPIAVEHTLKGVKSVATIVRSMKALSHPGGEEMAPHALNEALENVINVSRNEWKYVAEMEVDFDEKVTSIECSLSKLNQVFLNIIVNGAQAIEEQNKKEGRTRGHLRVATRLCEESVEITFEDDGTGIPQEIQQKIYDPFFTTKEVGKGTGQGLAISYKVIQEHCGTLSVESEEGKGATFCITLPLTQKGEG